MTFRILSDEVYADNEARVAAYEQQLHSPEGERYLHYLKERGLELETIRRFRLGAVLEPDPTDLNMAGRICIPHSNQRGVSLLRFRVAPWAEREGSAKYMQGPGTPIGVYNITELLTPRDVIAICEGEFDTMVLNQLGVPAVGYPGTQSWENHHRYLFEGYARVIIIGDGDQAGEDFAAKLANSIASPRVIPMPAGHDITSSYLEAGADDLLEHLGFGEKKEED